MYKNEKGIIFVFAPLILLSLVFITVDTYNYEEKYEPAYEYFKNLYSNRILIFSIIVLGWRYAKQHISGYILLLIFYLFNILIVLSDIFNIHKFLKEYEDQKDDSKVDIFYSNFLIKNYVNYFFFISWCLILLYNIYQWYKVYKYSQRIEVSENNENKED